MQKKTDDFKFKDLIKDYMVYKIGNESSKIEYPNDIKALKDENPLETVLIAYDTSTFDLITMDRQTRFTDQLSAVGGTMGLLTGFSLISGVEILFFAGKWLAVTTRHKLKNFY